MSWCTGRLLPQALDALGGREQGVIAAHRVQDETLVLDLLFHLVRHRDRVVPKEELLSQLWSGAIVLPAAHSISGRRLSRGA
jgi:hypothetical protein